MSRLGALDTAGSADGIFGNRLPKTTQSSPSRSSLESSERRGQLVGHGVMAVRYNTDSVADRDKCPRLKPWHATLIGDVGLSGMAEVLDVARKW
jgi:hypothetical protein